jgi:hypothetical protein
MERCALVCSWTPPSDDTALGYMEKSFPNVEQGADTVKALEKADTLTPSESPPPTLFLEECVPSEERLAPRPEDMQGAALLHGRKPFASPEVPSDSAGEDEGLRSPIRLQVAASIARGALPSRGSSCQTQKKSFFVFRFSLHRAF